MHSTVRAAPASFITAWMSASDGDTVHDFEAAIDVNEMLPASQGNGEPNIKLSTPVGSSAPHVLPVTGLRNAGLAPVAGSSLRYVGGHVARDRSPRRG